MEKSSVDLKTAQPAHFKTLHRMVLLRVFNGGSGSVQCYPFTAAIGEISVQAGMNITVETLSICEVKDSNWSLVELVDWLLGSDAHFILSHVHQGKSSAGINQMGWNVNHLEEQLRRLANHNGFPSGVQLKCHHHSDTRTAASLPASPQACVSRERKTVRCLTAMLTSVASVVMRCNY